MSIIRRLVVAAGAAVISVTAGAQGMSPDIKPIPAEQMPLAPQRLLLDIEDTGKRLVAVGERGHIVASLDGVNWVQAPVPTRATLTALDFIDAERGWAVGHDATILHTADGGRTWKLQNFEPEAEKPFLDVLFLTPEKGFAIGAYSLMYTTEDGGKNWAPLETPVRDDEWHFNRIVQLNDGSLFIAGEAGTLAISQDGGDSWENIDSPYDSSLFGAAPLGAQGVAIFGLRGNVFHAENAADPDWQRIDTGQEQSLIGGAALGGGDLVMVGINGIIFRTRNGLSKLQTIANPVGKTLAAVQPVKNGYIVVGEAGAQLIRP